MVVSLVLDGTPNKPVTSDRALSVIMESVKRQGFALVTPGSQEFDHEAFLRQLGRFMPQYDGNEIWDLLVEPGMDDVYHSRNAQALEPHTEAYEYAGSPPRYVALWCIRPAEDAGGATTLADGWDWISSLGDRDVEALHRRRYRWRSSDGLARRGIRIVNEHPVLEALGEGLVLRFSCSNVSTDDLLDRVVANGREYFEGSHVALQIERNALLIWDNWRMMHSRTAFTDRRRHLKRVLIAA